MLCAPRLSALAAPRLLSHTSSCTSTLRIRPHRPFSISFPNRESDRTRPKADSTSTFPWRLKNAPDRDTIDTFRPSSFLSPLTNPFKREFTRWLARSFTNTAYGDTYVFLLWETDPTWFTHLIDLGPFSYFQIPFPGGAALAFDKLCTTITEYTNPSTSEGAREHIDESLRLMLDRPLYKRISSACNEAVDKNERIVLSAKIHDVRVTDIHVRYAKETGYLIRMLFLILKWRVPSDSAHHTHSPHHHPSFVQPKTSRSTPSANTTSSTGSTYLSCSQNQMCNPQKKRHSK